MPRAKGVKLVPKKILVPIDFSASSEAALRQARRLPSNFMQKSTLCM